MKSAIVPKLLIPVLLPAMLVVSVNAETVYLKDGSILHGTIVKANAYGVQLQTEDGGLLIIKDHIKNIDYTPSPSTITSLPPIEESPQKTDEAAHGCAEGMVWRYNRCYPAQPALGPASSPAAQKTQPIQIMDKPETESMPFESDKQRWHVLLGFDTYLPGNAADGIKSDVQTAAQKAAQYGISSAYSFTTYSGYGVRAGCFYSLSDNFALGPSLGYVVGPKTSGSLAISSYFATATFTENWERNFTRLMAEGQIGNPRSKSLSMVLGGGAGIAWGRFSRNTTCLGACSASDTASAQWSGLSWEISPAFAWRGIMLGYRYTRFPTFNGNDTLSKMAWSTSEFFTSFMF